MEHDNVMVNICSFIPEEHLFLDMMLVSRQFYNWSYASIENFVLRADLMEAAAMAEMESNKKTDQDTEKDEYENRLGAEMLRIMKNLLSRMTRLRSLTLDGFGENVLAIQQFNHRDDHHVDNVLQSLFSQGSIKETLTELHLRNLCTASDIVVSDLTHLTRLTLSFMGRVPIKSDAPRWKSLTVEDLPSLKSVLLHDCTLPRKVTFRRVPQLSSLSFDGCDRLSDGRLLKILSQFDNTLAQSAASHLHEHSLSQSLSQNMSSQASDSLTASEVLMTVPVRSQEDLASRKLSRLTLNQCQPLKNPIIVVDTLEDLRINNCVNLAIPFIRCDNLKTLHIMYCPNLENLLLGCDNLKSIDLHMSGKDDGPSKTTAIVPSKTSSRQAIVDAIRQHYGKDNITISM